MTPEQVMRAATDAYERIDAEGVARFIAEDIRYRIHGADGKSPFKCDVKGAHAFWDAVANIHADWEVRQYKMVDLITNGERIAARVNVEVVSHHTGRSHFSQIALIGTVRNGQIAELNEYHDTALLASARD